MAEPDKVMEHGEVEVQGGSTLDGMIRKGFSKEIPDKAGRTWRSHPEGTAGAIP